MSVTRTIRNIREDLKYAAFGMQYAQILITIVQMITVVLIYIHAIQVCRLKAQQAVPRSKPGSNRFVWWLIVELAALSFVLLLNVLLYRTTRLRRRRDNRQLKDKARFIIMLQLFCVIVTMILGLSSACSYRDADNKLHKHWVMEMLGTAGNILFICFYILLIGMILFSYAVNRLPLTT